MLNAVIQGIQDVSKAREFEALKEKILAAIGYELVYALDTFPEEKANWLRMTLNEDPHVGERIATLIDTLNLLEGKCDNYPQW
ncbi:MAG: hypothetical protein AB2448_07265 [Moorella sp. (in: firmicutes)]